MDLLYTSLMNGLTVHKLCVGRREKKNHGSKQGNIDL